MNKMTFIDSLTIKEIEDYVKKSLADVRCYADGDNAKVSFDGTVVGVQLKAIKVDNEFYSNEDDETLEQRAAVESTGYKATNTTPVEETLYYELCWDCEDGELWAEYEITEEEYNNFGKGE